MTYTLQIDNAAYKIFKKLPKPTQKKAISEAQALIKNPDSGKSLKGEFSYLRSLRFNFKGTSYRIIYQTLPKTSTIVVRLADTRENIYRRLKKMKTKSLSG
jgi:mRNA-degrading endonuclease RelE of RelBE toxin-antitoxin system